MPDHDADLKKGAVESDRPGESTQTSLTGQLPHRPEDSRIKGQDTDFPEPGENPEHSGEEIDPGFVQENTRNGKKDGRPAA
jgi:hypothetical protein